MMIIILSKCFVPIYLSPRFLIEKMLLVDSTPTHTGADNQWTIPTSMGHS